MSVFQELEGTENTLLSSVGHEIKTLMHTFFVIYSWIKRKCNRT